MHGNSKKNQTPNHLYAIYDKEEDESVYKFGISSQALNQDGSSPRANEQVNLFNRVVGWARFFARVLVTGIRGRKEALRLEQENIENYELKTGKKPRGNDYGK